MAKTQARLRRDLRLHRVGASALAAVVALLSALAYAVVALSTNALRDEAQARVRTTATVGATVVEREMAGVSNVVQFFSRRPGLVAALALPQGQEREAALRRHLDQLSSANSGFAGVFIARTDGVLTNAVPSSASIIGKSFAFRDWYAGVRATGGPYVSEAYKTALAGHPLVVAVATYVRVDGDPRGLPTAIVAAVYRLDALAGFTNQVAKAQSVELTVVDQHGLLITDRGAPTNEIAAYDDAPRGGYLTDRATVRTVGWTVRADMSEARALKPVGRLRRTVVAVAAALAGAVGIVMLYVVWLLRRRRSAESARQQTERRIADVIDASNDAFVSIDEGGQIVEWNRQAEALLGWPRAEAIGAAMVELIVPPRLRADHLQGFARYLKTKQPHAIGQRLEISALHRDGHEIPVEMSLWVSQHGSDTRFSSFLHDISHRLRYEAELLASARTDALTGVGNRLRMSEDLDALHERLSRYRQNYAVALVDVDNFKGYNDMYGHLAGDLALRRIAEELRRVVRGADAVYRYGGEEFVVVLPAQSAAGAMVAAERLREGVEALTIPHAASEWGVVTISAGVAVAAADGAVVADTLRRADSALYAAKHAGRNRVEVAVALVPAATRANP